MPRISHLAMFLLACSSMPASAADFVMDGSDSNAHSFVLFKANHMGISPLWGRFDQISGRLSWDADSPGNSSIHVEVGTTSLDTAHAERNAHLMSADYIDAVRFPLAVFDSTAVSENADGTLAVTGNLSFRDVTREIVITATKTGEGETFFGDYRVGFEGTATIDARDFGVDIQPLSTIELVLSLEGIRR